MKLYELVNKYHIGTDLTCAEAMFKACNEYYQLNLSLTCAEAMFKACNEYYQLNLSEETRKMFSVMGIGMQSELSCCGAFTVAAGMIGLFTAEEGKTDVDNSIGYNLIIGLTKFMIEEFGTLQCSGLKELEIQGYENPCHFMVEAIAKKLEELLEKKSILDTEYRTNECCKGVNDRLAFTSE